MISDFICPALLSARSLIGLEVTFIDMIIIIEFACVLKTHRKIQFAQINLRMARYPLESIVVMLRNSL